MRPAGQAALDDLRQAVRHDRHIGQKIGGRLLQRIQCSAAGDEFHLQILQPGYAPGDRTVLEHGGDAWRSEEHTSELQSLMRISYAVFCLKKKTQKTHN